MKFMKKPIIFAILVAMVLLLPTALSATISAPQKVASNVNWTFSISLDSGDSFDTTDILFDDKKIATVYSNGQVQKDPLNGKFVFDAFVFDDQPNSAAGMTLYISYAGLSSGTYSARATTYQGGAVKSEAEKAIIEVFSPAGIEEIDSKIADAATDKEKLLAQINTLEQDLLSLKNTVAEKDSSINSLQSQLDEANQKIEQANSRADELESDFSGKVQDVSDNLSDLTAKFLPVEEKVFPKEEPNALIGFATFSAGFAQKNWLGLFLILVAAVIAVFFISGKGLKLPGKRSNVYDDFEDDSSSGILNSLKFEGLKSHDDEINEAKGKWARK